MGTRTSSPGRNARVLRSYALGVALSIAFVALRMALEPWLQGQAPLIVLLAAPMLAAWLGGLGAGVVATLVCAAAGEVLFVGEWPYTAREQLRLAVFLTYGLLFSVLAHLRRRSLGDIRDEHARLRQAREQLAQRERRMRETLEASPSGMLVVDAEGRIELVNREAERLFGYGREELVGLSVDALVPDAVRSRHAGLRRDYHGNPVHLSLGPGRELFARRKDGTEFPVQIGLNPLGGESRGLVLASVLDISSQHEAEAALQRSQVQLQENAAMFRSLADNIAQLAWMTDAAGQLAWYNRRWFDYTGTTFEEMMDRGWQWLHHPDHLARVEEKFRRHVASGDPWQDIFPLRGKDGQYRWFLSHAFPLRDHAGRIQAWFGTNTDITAQLEAEHALREADRRKDEFIAMLAHELRNPLAPVRNAVEILKLVGGDDARLERAREIIGRQVTHMARLIDDLLDVGRIARGKLTLRMEPCDAAAIVARTAEDYRASLEEAGQRLVVHESDRPAWVQADGVRLAQMLGNLLMNAARFTNGPGTVEVRTIVEGPADRNGPATVRAGPSATPRAELVEAPAPSAARVHIVVRDTGMGMDEDLLERLFDPFAQGMQDIARSKGGLGLGLALTQGLAELHGGTVSAHSEGPGRGSTFTVSLPLATSAGLGPTSKGKDEDSARCASG